VFSSVGKEKGDPTWFRKELTPEKGEKKKGANASCPRRVLPLEEKSSSTSVVSQGKAGEKEKGSTEKERSSSGS